MEQVDKKENRYTGEYHLVTVQSACAVTFINTVSLRLQTLEKSVDEKLHDLYLSPNIVLMFKSRRMRRTGRAARVEGNKVRKELWWGNLKERGN